MPMYKVQATMDIYYQAEIEANSTHEAFKIAVTGGGLKTKWKMMNAHISPESINPSRSRAQMLDEYGWEVINVWPINEEVNDE